MSADKKAYMFFIEMFVLLWSQLVLPAGQVEIATTGHVEDFEDATLILREDIDKINNLILVRRITV